MNEIKLSKRLETVANEIIPQSVVADIGSDHAYLPCYAVLKGIATRAVAGEVVEGPFQSAVAKVRECGLTDKIIVRKGNGLAAIEKGEVDVVTIAGMGGALIRDILEAGKEKLVGVTRLVLQPNIGAHNIREWLLENHWELIREHILEEDGKIYEVLVAEKGEALRPYTEKKRELFMGPFLCREQNDVFKKKWEYELQNYTRILAQLDQAAASDEARVKREEITEKINLIKEVL